jgi:hypothetical protein
MNEDNADLVRHHGPQSKLRLNRARGFQVNPAAQ